MTTADAILTLAGSILIYAVLWFFKSPKEVSGELADQIAAIREDQQESKELTARHDERILALIRSIDRLTERIDRLEPPNRQNGRNRTSG